MCGEQPSGERRTLSGQWYDLYSRMLILFQWFKGTNKQMKGNLSHKHIFNELSPIYINIRFTN